MNQAELSEKFGDEKLRTSTLANYGTLRNIADFALALSNTNKVRYLMCLRFL